MSQFVGNISNKTQLYPTIIENNIPNTDMETKTINLCTQNTSFTQQPLIMPINENQNNYCYINNTKQKEKCYK